MRMIAMDKENGILFIHKSGGTFATWAITDIPESIMPSEISQTEKDEYIISLISEL